ncbi:branched-chain amino acid transport system ATP-binding protein [Bradyrhizobium oligotrophicum S58]|uniref:Branched-chain amino acid transport system ATP-binding protein n=1 Tax=Bradyrhizobium oligotrophicum S58 TaxID=1245469 RepID=M4Z365_9BRAD|nr:branched-chain amino acid transport system ATP-binding protein [Bradyrhizobium oligotrophicum S58]
MPTAVVRKKDGGHAALCPPYEFGPVVGAHTRCRAIAALPPPLWGRAGEGGTKERLPLWTPTPDPSPQGGGERTVAAAAASLSKPRAY